MNIQITLFVTVSIMLYKRLGLYAMRLIIFVILVYDLRKGEVKLNFDLICNSLAIFCFVFQLTFDYQLRRFSEV